MLRNNQVLALKESLNNDFNSGIHYHATGTGKSVIALELIDLYHQKYPKNNIIWICEKKIHPYRAIFKRMFKEKRLSSHLTKF